MEQDKKYFYQGTEPILTELSQPEYFQFFPLDINDTMKCINVPLKENEMIVRVETKSSREYGVRPLVKVDTQKLLVYFPEKNEATGVAFKPEGHKISYLKGSNEREK